MSDHGRGPGLPPSGSAAARTTALGCGPRGFTLLELLVSLVIFAALAVMAYGGLRTVLDARDRTALQAARLAELQTFYTLIGRDIRQAVKRAVRDNYGDEKPALEGGGTVLEFTRTGWRNPAGVARSHLLRVAYALDEGHLSRSAWPAIDRAQDSAPRDHVVLREVNAFEVRFLDRDNEWRSEWPPENTGRTPAPSGMDLPRAVEVTVELEQWGRISRLFLVAGAEPAAPAGQV